MEKFFAEYLYCFNARANNFEIVSGCFDDYNVLDNQKVKVIKTQKFLYLTRFDTHKIQQVFCYFSNLKYYTKGGN